MAALNWTFDADGLGPLKNHALSNELLATAFGQMKILPFTQRVPGFGPHMGETVNIMSVNELPIPTSGQLTENQRIPIDRLTFNNRALTIVPWGRGVEYTDLMSDLNVFNIENIIQKRLMIQMEQVMDDASAAAFQDPATVLITFIPTSATAGTFDTDGTPSTVATSNLTWSHIGLLADYLTGTIHVPPYAGGEYYIGIASRLALRGLKDDNVVQAYNMYLQKGDLFYRGEVGLTENIRWIASHRQTALDNSAGTSTVLGNAFVFGDEAVARAVAEHPHLRLDPNYQSDFHRVSAAAWYGKLQFGAWWNTAKAA